MAEVEDVPRLCARAAQDVVDAAEQPLLRTEQQRWVEVALHGEVRTDDLAAAVEGSAPVEADDVSSRLTHGAEQVPGARAEVDEGDVERGEAIEDAFDVGEDELAVVGLVESPHPRVEQLERLGTG